MEDLIYGLIGIAMFVWQVWAIVVLFGGKLPESKWVRIYLAISLIMMFLAVIWLTM